MMRKFWSLLSALCMLLAMLPGLAAAADEFPDRPITLIVPYAAGGPSDTLARLLANHMSKALGQPVVVTNLGGAGGMIGLKRVISAKPDGYTLVIPPSDLLSISPFTFKEQPFDPLKDLTYIGPVTRLNRTIIAVPPNSPAKTFQEFVKLAKTAPKQLNYASDGIGSKSQLGFETMSGQLGFQMVHIPFPGGGRNFQAAMAGQVDVVSGVGMLPYLKSGQLRPIAIAGKVRSADFPEVPTLVELGLGDEVFGENFYGVLGPPQMPKPIVDKLAKAISDWTQLKEIVEPLKAMGHNPTPNMSAVDAVDFIRRAIAVNEPVIRRLGISAQ